MTPDEIARKVVDEWWETGSSLRDAIAEAIRTEREKAEEVLRLAQVRLDDRNAALMERDHAEAERDRLRALVEECAPYLKDGETPIQRIERDFKDSQALLAMLAKDRAERDRLRDALELYNSAIRVDVLLEGCEV